jgi:hypothetical protein
VANETGRQRLPITQGIDYIDGGEMSDFANVKGRVGTNSEVYNGILSLLWR